MSSEWRTVEISSLCEGIFDGPHATPKKTSQGPIFLGISSLKRGRLDLENTEHLSEDDFKKWTKRVVPQEGDIVFSYETRLGEAAIIPADLRCCLGRRMALMRIDRTKALPEYMLYAYLSPAFQNVIKARAIHGSTVDRIPLTEFGSYPISVPPLQTQQEIAKILGALDDRITLLRETNKTLESIAQAVFKSWFVDFDPVRAKMEGHQPEGMDEATAALFPDSFEESELGLIPKGWFSGQLDDIAATIRTSVAVSDFNESMAYLGLEHLPRKVLSITEWSTAAGLESTKTAFSIRDILFGRLRPYFHKVAIAPLNGVCSTDILVCRPKKAMFHALVALYLFSDALVEYADRLSNGAKMPRVNWKDLAAYPVTIPPEIIASSFDSVIQPIFDRMRANIFQIHTLASLRDTLLPRLISGQLRLPEAQAVVEEHST